MVRAGGSASWIIGDQGTTDPAEESVFLRLGEASRHGTCWWGMSMAPVGLQAHKLFRHWGAIPQKYMDGITEGCRSWLNQCWDEGIRLCRTLRSGWTGAHHRWSPPVSGVRRSGRGMRPAGGNSRSLRKLNAVSTSEVGKMDSFPNGLVVKKNARVVSLSVGVEKFSPEAVPSGVPLTGRGQKVTGTIYPLGM